MTNFSLDIFLSHSSKDFMIVRQIRNQLEELGHRPLMFHLKCLEQNGADSLFDLIKKEIDAREWFILCKSRNSEKSEWVKKEMAYVLEKRIPEIIDLEDNVIPIGGVVKRFMDSSKLFLVYPPHEKSCADTIIQCLESDYQVFATDYLHFDELHREATRQYLAPDSVGTWVFLTTDDDAGLPRKINLPHSKVVLHLRPEKNRNRMEQDLFMSGTGDENFNLYKDQIGEWRWIVRNAVRIFIASRAIRKDDLNDALYFQRGELYEDLGCLVRALIDYHRADELLKNHPRPDPSLNDFLRSKYFNAWDNLHCELRQYSVVPPDCEDKR